MPRRPRRRPRVPPSPPTGRVTSPATIADLARALASGETSSEAVVLECLARVQDRGAATNAFIAVWADRALAAARAADQEIAAGRTRGPLHGVPISLKDLVDVSGTPTTAASAVRREHIAPRDAAIVTRLQDAGAVLIGKTNLHEFALGPTNDDSAYGPVRHPADNGLSSGGSSGGSAVSVALGMAWASIGTDTGGSIRIPASLCGVVGLKPSFGDVSTDGIVPLSASLDHVGPLCRSVGDARLLHEVLAGSTPPAGVVTGPRGLRLAVPRAYFLDRLDDAVGASFERACARLVREGATLDTATVPHAVDTAPIYLCIALAEAAEYHAATIETRPHDYTAAIRPRLQAGRYILAEDYLRAQRGRRQLTAEVDAALDGYDALLLPTVPVPAQPVGASTVRVGDWEESVRSALLRLTQLFNVTGHPAITVPGEPTPSGLPVGIQLVGARGATSRLLDVAAALEPTIGAA
jgi:aspartyl-tRNA(Asn)/glutamyl-tRNA(Gln) amidotransferase subunit A